MKFAVQVGGGQVRHDKTGLEAIVEQALTAEALGFDTVFVPDHYVFEALGTMQCELPAYEMSLVMATLAQRTRKIRIGSHVACVLFRHPAMLARLFAQLDEASGGRVIAGIGAGWTRAEFTMMGIDFPPVGERLAMLDEAVLVLRGLWGAEPFTFAGRYYQLTDAVCLPRPVQDPHPPLMLGGSGNGILRRAGTWADIIHMAPAIGAAGTTTLASVAEFDDASVTDKLRRVRAAEAAAGRSPGSVRFASTIFTYAATDSPDHTRHLAENLGRAFSLGAEDVLRHPVVLIGTEEEMTAELRRRERAHGLELLAINFSELSQLQAFGERVLPALA